MKLFKSILMIALIFIVLYGCQKDIIGPLGNNMTPPGTVSNVKVLNQSGQATLTYTLPTDDDIAYVKAEYTLLSGAKREVRASFYTSQMVVDGFGDTEVHTVTLRVVNKSEVPSAPITVQIKPLENAIQIAFRTMKVVAAFGGINVSLTNTGKANLSIIPMRQQGYKGWVPFDGIYTAAEVVSKNIRGLETVPIKIAVVIRDRFLNQTDTLFAEVTPLFEMPLAKSLYKEMPGVIWPGDQKANFSNNGIDATGIKRMWDGETVAWPSCAYTPPTVTDQGPHSITFDLGQTAQLSRLVIWDYPETISARKTYFYRGNMKNFEIWGSANPNPDGSYDSWYKLGTYQSVKPSGLPYGEVSDEDLTTAQAGFSWDLDINVPKLRYLRIKNLSNWQGTNFLLITEVQAYGNPK
ncbi:DUF4959 domain-containing protein [Pedobacter hiemivivus]|uniref:DUF4959 domain-containing protein n=1 Tax=Pedobacter hiemivivus TaxID=2530454 RepID=A0A4U1GEG4_9SPHI|nr:DUF5000 domain-containing lipoprotein [Pedobacter hiemivivus]TKC61379.1 DUF4959 domain-containing protein [Pedobacter hiemivivus]